MKHWIIILSSLYIIMIQSNAQEIRSVEEARGLMVGDIAPDFKAVDASGNVFQLAEALQNGPVVMIFYRGHWCPICNKHLGTIQDSLQLIVDKGASVIAISPQKPELHYRPGRLHNMAPI